MSGLKDWSKVFVTALIVAIATQVIGKVFIKSDKIEYAATKTELTEATDRVKMEAIEYTDLKIEDHEKVHKQISIQYTQIQSDLTIIKAHLINK